MMNPVFQGMFDAERTSEYGPQKGSSPLSQPTGLNSYDIGKLVQGFIRFGKLIDLEPDEEIESQLFKRHNKAPSLPLPEDKPQRDQAASPTEPLSPLAEKKVSPSSFIAPSKQSQAPFWTPVISEQVLFYPPPEKATSAMNISQIALLCTHSNHIQDAARPSPETHQKVNRLSIKLMKKLNLLETKFFQDRKVLLEMIEKEEMMAVSGRTIARLIKRFEDVVQRENETGDIKRLLIYIVRYSGEKSSPSLLLKEGRLSIIARRFFSRFARQ